MSDRQHFITVISVIISVFLLFAALIATSLIRANMVKENVALALEKGENPMYVKCAMEDSLNNTNCAAVINSIVISNSAK
jgi:hypothetical protein